MKQLLKKIIIFILISLSRLVLWKYKPKIVGITGSVGKTSTKDAAYAVLSKFYSVRKSDKSFNSEIGIPLTILGCPNGWNDPVVWFKNIIHGLKLIIRTEKYPEWLVIEVGADKPGDIESVAKWLRTDVAIMTRIGELPVHVEFFKSRAHLIEEKGYLVKSLKKDGILIVNADDEDTLRFSEQTKNIFFTYGWSDRATLQASNSQVLYRDEGGFEMPYGITFRLNSNGNSLPVNIYGGFGTNHAYAALAALALAEGMKLDLLIAIEALREYEMPPGRMRLLHGASGSLILDDTYNSSPVACVAALETLGQLEAGGRKIAVIGDMLELGKYSNDEHKKIGAVIAQNTDALIAVGMRAAFCARGAEESGMPADAIFSFNDAREAGEFLVKLIGAGDVVLVKGSQGMRMERTVEMLLENRDRDRNLLVRQEKEWLGR